MSGSFLKFSCSVESEIISNPLSYFPLWMDLFLTYIWKTMFVMKLMIQTLNLSNHQFTVYDECVLWNDPVLLLN